MKWLAGMRITADRLQQGDPTDIQTYVPAVTNQGTATFNTQIGYYTITDFWVDITIYITGNVAGSGAGLVTVAMPTNVDRTTRQFLGIHSESNGPGGTHIGGGEAVFFTSGSGALTDRLRIDDNSAASKENNITGADLLATGVLTISGRYRRI